MYLQKKFNEPVRMQILQRGWFSRTWRELDGALHVQDGGAVVLKQGEDAHTLPSPVKGGLKIYLHHKDYSQENEYVSDPCYAVKNFTVTAEGVQFEF